MAGRSKTGVFRFKRHVHLLLLSSALLSFSTLALAAAKNTPVRFAIPAQPLAAALENFAHKTGWQVGYATASLRTTKTQAISGTMSPEEALRVMLAGTGIEIRMTGPRSAALIVPETFAAKVPDDPSGVLDPIVVIAKDGKAKASDAPYETPGSSNYISGDDIQRTPPTSVGDMLKTAPGVMPSGNRVGASMDVNIRGLQGQNRVNVMVDGTRQTNNSYRGYRGSRNEVYVDPDFIGGIDISKGPFGGTGGVGAMGGVVNMRLLEAGDIVREGQDYTARIKTAIGNNTIGPNNAESTDIRNDGSEFFNGEAWMGNAVIATVKDDYELVAGFSRRKSGNYFAGSKGKSTFLDNRNPWVAPTEKKISPIGPGDEVFNTSQDITSFLAKGKYKWGDGHSLGLGYTFYHNEYGEFDETLLLFAQSSFFIPVTQYELSETTTHTVKTTYDYKPENNRYIALSANLWFSDVESSSGVIKAYSAGANSASASNYGGDAANLSSFDTPLGLLSMNNGTEFVLEQAREESPVTVGLFGVNPSGDRLLASAFNQSKLDITDWLTLAGSLRYDYYETKGKGDLADAPEKNGSRVNPSASVTVEPFEGIQLFGTYLEGWRPPSLREAASRQTEYLVPNPDLDPELSRNYEFGLNILRNDVFFAGDKFRFKAVRFDNTYDDYIIRMRRLSDGLYSWDNIDKAEFRGYEFSAAYDAGYAFLESTFTKYDHVSYCNEAQPNRPRCDFSVAGTDYGLMAIPPKYSGTVTAGVRLFEEALTFGGRAYFFGRRYGGYKVVPGAVNSPVYYDAKTVFDLFGNYKIDETFTVDFSLENVGDEYYLDPLSTGLVPSPGRTLRMGLTATF
ncbi:TonB-dependent receptor [Taklimakanibacter albus]|uniref:TonB-dependent receptor n=1 Tax=Taklimakanibacter albus TaxID=2800327 RepID=A0ACC5R3E8_9HYPH|nr:TonB-dependent receptor [Aestuariivirga sp. YIM B02566]MBK1867191.1 TonB-dependent receptor [Aestuariivirga sp. YIM B02566]